mmetsp:Transcript_43839/g.113188  ORF Transcript_43839/g.113188 Transcript_43839/m.113188 type:complete len:641 (-) Transcript_43839:64-1986(-)
MSTQGGSSSVWVWCPADPKKSTDFQHPADVPAGNGALAKTRFVEGIRGPKLARISPATLLQTKGALCLIAERGATREVPKPMVLPWYEGLLLLEEIEASHGQAGHIEAAWWEAELKTVLEQERAKFKNGQLSGTLYMEKRLAMTAVTGSRFVDSEDREFSYRRENVSANNGPLVEGKDHGNFFRIREITAYLPPWEAFCHEKCGFYQDFYQVIWEYPFSQVDYGAVENGCTSQIGATWEPDECLPAHLDSLRLAAKQAWIKRRREQVIKRTPSLDDWQAARGSPPGVAIKDEKEEDKKPVKRARVRRDGMALDRDLLRSAIGHDFNASDATQILGGVRSGWPKHPQDYPKGFGVADPPGFCKEGCDCMDDQRPQRSWETHKAWLEEGRRSSDALASVEGFSLQTRFVRRRGSVSKMCFFESSQGKRSGEAHSRAALELATAVEKAITGVTKTIPLTALASRTDIVKIPARAFLTEDLDYEPLRYEGQLATGGSLPAWARMEEDTGRIFSEGQVPQSGLQLLVEFSHAEGPVGRAACTLTTERFSGPESPWASATVPIIQRFNDLNVCPLEKGARGVLFEHFGELWDFKLRAVRERPVGVWLETMARILRMLRSGAVCNITLAAVHTRTASAGVLPGRISR